MKLTDVQRDARIEALNEAAEHLDLRAWTDDEEEKRQGRFISAQLRRQMTRLAQKGRPAFEGSTSNEDGQVDGD